MLKLDGNQKSFINKNISKRCSPAKRLIILTLILFGLSTTLAPTTIQAKNAAQKTNQTSSAISQVESQGETKYSQEDIKKGTERVNDNIKSYESEYKQDGKTKKSQEELANNKNIANVLRGLDKDSLGKYAESIDIKSLNTSNFKLITANDEIIDYTNFYGVNITDDFLQGEKNLKEQIANLHLTVTKEGEIKTADKINIDEYSADILKDYLISKEEIKSIFAEPKIVTKDKTTSQIASERMSQISEKNNEIELFNKKVSFISNEFNEQCVVNNKFNGEIIFVAVNGKCLTYMEKEPSGWVDKTKMMNEYIKSQQAEQEQ